MLSNRYGIEFEDADDVQIELFMVRHGGYFQGKGNGLYFHHRAAQILIWPDLDRHRWTELTLKEMTRPMHTVTALMGPGSCVVGETKLLNPVTGDRVPIAELYSRNEAPIVMTVFGPKQAHVPFLKGYSDLLRVTLESGKSFIATPGHRCLTESGFRAVSTLQIGQSLLSYDESHLSTNLACERWSFSSARHLLRTHQDSQSDCRSDFRSCGEPLRDIQEVFRGVAPSQSCAPQLASIFSHSDGMERTHQRNPSISFDHPSSLDAFVRGFHKRKTPQYRCLSETCEHAYRSFQLLSLSSLAMLHLQPFSKQDPYSSHSCLGDEMPYGNYRVQADRVQHISPAGFGPYYDLTVPDFHHYFAEGTIHHNTGKTHEASKWGLIEYFADPDNTCVMVSSTDIRGLKLRVWGELTMLWQRAIENWPSLPGHLLDSKIAITTDALEDGDLSDRQARDMRKAMCGIPCLQNNKFVGLSKFVGIKQKRVRLVGDELSLMSHQYLKAFSNLNNNEDFQSVVCFNPNDPSDPGGVAAEPVDGWSSHMEPTKTECWDTKFMHGRCVNLVGTDSPNFDDPKQPNRYKYLIGPRKINDVIVSYGKDSYEYYTQCMGVMKVGVLSRRVLTRDMCRQFRANEDVVWKDTNRTRLYGLDASYGGDRCVAGWCEYGLDADDKNVFKFHPPWIIPIKPGKEPEDQIAERVKADCESLGIPPANMYFDATGRGSLGTSLARLWSDQCNPVEFGGPPSPRPVSLDIYIRDPDTQERRLQRCDEHYDRFVTELWFSVRYAVESEQVRGLPPEVMEELCMRTWSLAKNNKKSVEPKSSSPGKPPGMKERTGRSPDLGDWSVICVEGARRKGFVISKLGSVAAPDDEDYFDTEAKEYEEAIEASLLKH